MGGNDARIIVWLFLGVVHAHHPHGPEWGAQRPSRVSKGSSAAFTGGGPTGSAAAGRRSSMSITLSAASDPFASARQLPGQPLVQFARGGVSRSNSQLPTGLNGRGRSSRGPGYLVIPASALIQFLASRSNRGGIPNAHPTLHSGGFQFTRQGTFGQTGSRPPGFPPVGSIRGVGRLSGGAGPGYSVLPLDHQVSSHPLLNALGIGGSGAVGAVHQGPAGVDFLGQQGGQFQGISGTLAGSGIPIIIQAPGSGTNQGELSIANNTRNSIIIQDGGNASGQQGGEIVIGGNGGTITIKGNLNQSGSQIEQEEIENEENHKKKKGNTGPSTKNDTLPIVLNTSGGQTQTIVIGSGGGTFTIGGQTSGGNSPGNATFILGGGSSRRIDA